MSRRLIRTCLLPLAILLIAGNVAITDSGLTGGLKRWKGYLIPYVVSVPDVLRLQLIGPNGKPRSHISVDERAVLLLHIEQQMTRNGRLKPSVDGSLGWMLAEAAQIAIHIERIDLSQTYRPRVLKASQYWRPTTDDERTSTNERSSPQAGMIRFLINEELELSPGRYALFATIFADPPYGAGIAGHGVEPPRAHLSLTEDRPWIVTRSTPRIEIQVIE